MPTAHNDRGEGDRGRLAGDAVPPGPVATRHRVEKVRGAYVGSSLPYLPRARAPLA